MGLTIKQENFCNYYVESGNASEAYRRAYSCDKMKDEAVVVEASKLKDSPNVALRIDELKAKLQSKSDITKERILNELSSIVFADIRDYVHFESREVYNEDTGLYHFETQLNFKPFSELTDSQAKAIESIKQTRDGFELKLHGKNWSMEKVCKMLGFDMPTVSEVKYTEYPSLDKTQIDKAIDTL